MCRCIICKIFLHYPSHTHRLSVPFVRAWYFPIKWIDRNKNHWIKWLPEAGCRLDFWWFKYLMEEETWENTRIYVCVRCFKAATGKTIKEKMKWNEETEKFTQFCGCIFDEAQIRRIRIF